MSQSDVDTPTFIFPINVRGYVSPENFHMSYDQDRIVEECGDGSLIVDYQSENDCHKLSAGMWYSGEGRFEMIINHVDRDTALRMFALAANEACRAEINNQGAKPEASLFRVVEIKTDGWSLFSKWFKSKAEAGDWAGRECLNENEFMIIEDHNATAEYIRAMLYEG